MHVTWTPQALAEFEALRQAGRARLYERVEELVRGLEANPRDHRRQGRQIRTSDGGFGWCQTVSAGPDRCLVAWRVEGEELSIRVIKLV